MRQHSGVPLHLNLPTFADWLVSPQASRCFWSQSPQRSRALWVKWRQVYFWMASSHFLQGIYFLVCLITSNNKYISVSLRMWIAKWEQMFCDNSFLERKWQKYISCGAVGSGVGGGGAGGCVKCVKVTLWLFWDSDCWLPQCTSPQLICTDILGGWSGCRKPRWHSCKQKQMKGQSTLMKYKLYH